MIISYKMNKQIEAQGGELVLKNSHGDIAIIPKNKVDEVNKALESNNHQFIDELVSALPNMENYAEIGTVIGDPPTDNDNIFTGYIKKSYPETYEAAENLYSDATNEAKAQVLQLNSLYENTKKGVKNYLFENDKEGFKENRNVKPINSIGDNLLRVGKEGTKKGFKNDTYDLDIHNKKEVNNPNLFNNTTKKRCDETGCAAFIGNGFEDINKRDYYNAYGDAWTMNNNILISGRAKKVYSIFDEDLPSKDLVYKNNAFDTKYIKNTIKEKIKNNPLDYNQLQSGDIINLYYGNSSNFQKAYENSKGNVYTTHIGRIEEDKKGKYIIHNIHGNIKKDYLSNLDKNDNLKISQVVRLDPLDIAKELPYKLNKKEINKYTNIGSEQAGLSYSGIENNKNKFIKDYKLSENKYDDLKRLSFGIMGKETYWGKSPYYHLKKTDIADAYTYIREELTGEKESMGWGQVKIGQTISKKELEKMGIPKEVLNDKEKMNDPIYSGISTMVTVIHNDKKLTDLLKTYNINDLDRETYNSLLAISHNQGFAKIEETIKKGIKEKNLKERLNQFNTFEYPKIVKSYGFDLIS